MIEYSEEGKRLVSTFLAYRNDIDIYTEDEEKDKEFYKELFKRLLSNRIKINDITPLGCRSNVITRCSNEPDNSRKKIFIIDGDIDIIHRKNIPSMKYLYVLDGYCIENFLFDRDSIVQFIYLHCAVKSRDAILRELDFENWTNKYAQYLVELFIQFAIANYFEKPFYLNNANRYHQNKKRVFDEGSVIKDIEELKNNILKTVNQQDYDAKYTELKERWPNNIDTFFNIVSGKDYLVPILLFKTNCFKKSQAMPGLEEVKMLLVQVASLQRLQNLKNTIESL